jgi:hypothetical protein
MPCVFCGEDRKLSREHVFPQWLKNHFPELEQVEADHVRRVVTPTTDDEHTRPGPAFDFVSRDVCEACNNGWMSDLENRAQPILAPMLADQPQVLTALDQATLATWATKTMLAMQGVNMGGKRVVGEPRYRWFERHRMPLPASHVWLCHYADRTRRPVVVHQWGITVAPSGAPPPRPDDPINGLGVAFAIGPVAFWLVAYDVPGGPHTEAASDDAHVLIWPALGPDVRWPPPTAVGSEDELRELSRRLPTGAIVGGDLSV